ncbi:hypothetical protein PFMG_00702 [Plasmodium falciparum IGH-CR14]|uniref:Uncharacterized protein n=2 Tax=Plasmodium falciparum TaxID=5833 RepID=A0A0L1I4F0_PLAFA|nr:hypothetical protein PFNF135_05040 [Plasmodium falciparum NF135/5.C10]KNG74504.1 hypothetical protein PFMG_00702 [Plasmodium falciparum IGH-CR14]SOS80687.1 conserved Plasmodium protein, unknown function [Plasmodium sp. gorilla clade G1]
MADNNNNYNNNINMDRLSEIFKSTLSLMKNTVHGLAQRNETIYNLLYMSDSMQNKNDNYNEMLSNEMTFNKNMIIKWVIIAIILYLIFMLFSYVFVNYVLFYAVIFFVCVLIIKYFVYHFNNNEIEVLENYQSFEANTI